MEALRDSPAGAVLAVKVVPHAARSALAGRHGDALRIRLAAPPVDGRANDELLRFLAQLAGLPPSAVTLLRGGAGRHKSVLFRGASAADLAARLGLADG